MQEKPEMLEVYIELRKLHQRCKDAAVKRSQPTAISDTTRPSENGMLGQHATQKRCCVETTLLMTNFRAALHYYKSTVGMLPPDSNRRGPSVDMYVTSAWLYDPLSCLGCHVH